MVSNSNPVQIDVLYFGDCPNHRPTVDLIHDVTSDLGIDATINELAVEQTDDLEALRFKGSPTVQVNGIDIESSTDAHFGFGCRMYGTSGIPSRELIANTLSRYNSTNGIIPHGLGKEKELSKPLRNQSSLVATIGSMVAAILGTACCWLPPLLLIFGVSASGLGSMFTTARPWLLTVAFICLGFGFFATYRKRGDVASCDASCCDSSSSILSRMHRGMLWAALFVVLLMAFFPSIFTTMFGDGTAMISKDLPIVTVSIEGMDCEACATTLQASLLALPEVTAASVSYESESAQINVNKPSQQTISAIRSVVDQAGFATKRIETTEVN